MASGEILALPFNAVVVAMELVLLKLVLKREWLAAPLWWSVPAAFVIMASFVAVLPSAGLLACMVGVVAVSLVLNSSVTFDLGG